VCLSRELASAGDCGNRALMFNSPIGRWTSKPRPLALGSPAGPVSTTRAGPRGAAAACPDTGNSR
jgi:hypothetical protein